MRKYCLLLMIVFIVISATSVIAGQPNLPPSPPERTFSLPPQASEVASGVYYLGTSYDKEKLVEGYALIHYKPGYAKPTNPAKPSKDPSCYTYLAKGAKWRILEPYIVDLTYSNEIAPIIASSIQKWEVAAGKDILGENSAGTIDGADMENPDNKNEVMFGGIEDKNVIAVTIVWGTFSAPVPSRELVEWDQVYNTDYDWSFRGEPDTTEMDFDNIATHELGHSVGMGDLYTSACSEQTMYGYAATGETKKRSLESGDIFGIKSLYK